MPNTDEISFLANHFNGPVSNGGKLVITPTQIIFRPHALNFNTIVYTWNIADVVSMEKGILTNFYINFADGKKHHFSLWKKQRVMDEINQRKALLSGGAQPRAVNPTPQPVQQPAVTRPVQTQVTNTPRPYQPVQQGARTCPGCGQPVAAGAKFCASCGTRLESHCPGCGKPVKAGDRFCTACGTRLS